MGFASAVTGGGDAAPVYPTTIDELKDYLTSEDPQVIVISGTYDFAGSEGTSDFDACNSYDCTPEDGGQALLNTLDGCGSTPTYSVSLDTAAYQGIQVASDKTLVGKDKATLKGKGLRFVDASNIIVQNIEITDLNPEYVWGGDALTFSGTQNVWIDHVTVSCLILILRMALHRMRSTSHQGANPALRIYRLRTRAVSTIPLDRTPVVASPSRTAFSTARRPTPPRATATHTGRWSLLAPTIRSHFTVSGSFLYRLESFSNHWWRLENHVYMTSGRTPALSGTTLFHAVNNVWSSNEGHLIEGGADNGRGLYEGNYFDKVPTVVASGWAGQLFTSDESDVSECSAYLGRDCVPNELSSSGDFSYKDTAFLSDFKDQSIPEAEPASSISSTVLAEAGNTL